MRVAMRFDNSYQRLPARFFARLPPTPVAAPKLVQLNASLASELGLEADDLKTEEGVRMLSGNLVPEGASPIAMAYAGHQFGQWVPQLGDGRAILLGEVIDVHGRRRDIQLKGAGPTPFSRMGDGRAALGPVLREYLVSEAMYALGVPTTRALAVVTTGEQVHREGFPPGAILTRVAASHVRIGTFEFFANRGDIDGVRTLADYVIERHFPDCRDDEQPYLRFLRAVVERTAALIARWQLVGFIHGVMNTDNMSIAGETIDFGPCAFMDRYDPRTVFSSIDHAGRYAYVNQPGIAQWNLVRLAQALLPLIAAQPEDAVPSAQAALDAFPATFDAAYLAGMRAKLGLVSNRAGDTELVTSLLACMAEQRADYTRTFRGLSRAVAHADDGAARALFADPSSFDAWTLRWRARIALETDAANGALEQTRAAMLAVNPAFIPRNHRIEALIESAVQGDFAPFQEMLQVLSRPFADQPKFERYAQEPEPHEIVQATFCGT